MIVVTFLLDSGIEVFSRAVALEGDTTDLTFMQGLRNILKGWIEVGATVLRIEVNDKGVVTWYTVSDVLFE